jgi:hypothetical protein
MQTLKLLEGIPCSQWTLITAIWGQESPCKARRKRGGRESKDPNISALVVESEHQASVVDFKWF